MAVATCIATVTKQWSDGRYQHIVGTIAISPAADTYATGGLTLSFAGKVLSSRPPIFFYVWGKGVVYYFNPGTTIANGLLQVFIEATVGTNTPLGEHTAAAIAAGVSGDTIRFHGAFERL